MPSVESMAALAWSPKLFKASLRGLFELSASSARLTMRTFELTSESARLMRLAPGHASGGAGSPLSPPSPPPDPPPWPSWPPPPLQSWQPNEPPAPPPVPPSVPPPDGGAGPLLLQKGQTQFGAVPGGPQKIPPTVMWIQTARQLIGDASVASQMAVGLMLPRVQPRHPRQLLRAVQQQSSPARSCKSSPETPSPFRQKEIFQGFEC